jgi:hypothetical protein
MDLKLRTNCDDIFRTLCTLAQRAVWCVYRHSTVADYTAEWHVRMPWIHTVDGMNWKSSALRHRTMTLCQTTGSRVSRSVLYWQTPVSASPHRKPDTTLCCPCCVQKYHQGVKISCKSLWRWYISTNIMFLDVFHRPVYFSKHNISETGF